MLLLLLISCTAIARIVNFVLSDCPANLLVLTWCIIMLYYYVEINVDDD